MSGERWKDGSSGCSAPCATGLSSGFRATSVRGGRRDRRRGLQSCTVLEEAIIRASCSKGRPRAVRLAGSL